MKRVFSLLLALCLMLCMVTPALAAEADPPEETAQVVDSGTIRDSAPPAKGIPEASGAEESAPDISLFSNFTGGDATFNTRVILTVTDRNGKPLEGAVYGLYASDGVFLDELVTGSDGTATSPDIPVDTDYYVEEITPPEGFLPNEGRKDIKLTDTCAPSSIDVTAEYDPIMGKIKVIKTDPDGNPLAGASFYVYDTDDFNSPLDNITTGEDGTVTTRSLLYGEYDLYEYEAPEGFSVGSYYGSYYITKQDEITEAAITNYPKKGNLKITKTGNDGRKIHGAVFSIYKADTDEWVQDATTGSSGYVYVYSLLLGNYYAVEKSVPAPYKLDDTRHDFSLAYDGQYTYLDVTNNVAGEPGKVKVIKTDDEDNPLSGVVFGLYRTWDGTKLDTLTSGEDGTAESVPLIPGDYYLVEETGKEGYTPVSGQIPFTIDGSGVTVEMPVVNPKIRIFGKVKVIKTDDAGSPIPGVVFGLYCDADNLLETLMTGEDGTAVSGVLNEGSYYLLEQESGVAGYQIDSERHPFSINENEVIVPVTVVNPRITGSVKIIKTGTDGQPLPGVMFGVYAADSDTELCQLTTSEDGTATSGPLFYGNYHLKELATVDGYELLDTPIPFSILEQGVAVEIPVTNPLILGGVEIEKTDEDGNTLAGAVFGLYNDRGQKLAELTCDDMGRASYDGLPKGRFYLKELKAPEGFTLPDSMIPFEIATQGQVQKITVENVKGYGKVEVIKTGEGGEPLSGVKFEIIRVSTGEKAGELVTDEAGAASLELPLGRYELVETATVPGYVLLSGSVPFSLTVDGDAVTLPIANRKEDSKGGQIRLTKRDKDTAAVLAGATFGIYRADNDGKAGEITTASDGTATSLPLPVIDAGYYLLELRAPEGYAASTEKYPVQVAEGQTVEITVTNTLLPPEQAKLRIIKQAEGSNARLENAVFGVYRSDDTKAGTLTTGADGTAEIALDAGSFYLVEEKAPAGYRLKTEKIPVTLEAEQTVEIIITNTLLPPEPAKLRIIKQAEGSNARLENAVFGVYRSDDTRAGTLTTSADGTAEITLDAGSFYLVEEKAPAGYRLKTDRIRVTLAAGQTVEIVVWNAKEDEPEKPGTLQLVKVDGSGKKLQGAVFGIYEDGADRPVGQLTTDQNGAAMTRLDSGSFYARELQAPDGYRLNDTPIRFTVNAGETVTLTVRNDRDDEDKPGILRIIKENEDGDRLKGAVFGIYDADRDKVDEITTDRDGEAEIELDEGDYTVKELKAPRDYERNGKKIRVHITAGKTKEITVENHKKDSEQPETGTLQIVKQAPCGQRLEGAVFGIYRERDGAQVDEATTGKNGTAEITLDTGRYFLAELVSPAGYQLDTQRYSFTVKGGECVSVTVTDEPIQDDPCTPTPTPPVPEVTIPKTGEPFPAMQYGLAALCVIVAALSGAAYCHQKKHQK